MTNPNRKLSFIFQQCEIAVERKRWVIVLLLHGTAIMASAQLSWSDEHTVLHSLHIPKAHRRKGYASELIRSCMSYCHKHGKKALSLTVSKKNAPAMELYRSLGMKSWWEDKDTLYMGVTLEKGD